MTTTHTPAKQARTRKVRGSHAVQGGTTEANRLAIVILEVLAGGCMPQEAAERLGISLPRYYQLETRALEGLVAACERKPVGKQANPETRIAALEKQLQRAHRECVRQQALVRMTQRSAGVAPVKVDKETNGVDRRRRKRRPMVRALKAAATLRKKVASAEAEAVQQRAPTGDGEPDALAVDSSQTAKERTQKGLEGWQDASL